MGGNRQTNKAAAAQHGIAHSTKARSKHGLGGPGVGLFLMTFSAAATALIVVTTGENADFIFLDLINKAVFFVDTAGPAARKLML
jgi:hypothetical protein